jgi:formylglycine-generating enzyme required for sulfatase activity
VATSTQDARCAHNASFVPGVFGQEVKDVVLAEVMDPDFPAMEADCSGWIERQLENLGDDLPMVCVDACDARAYCRWIGKRSCGELGEDGELDITQGPGAGRHSDPDLSEWYRACSNAGATAFPYGDTYEAGTCVDASYSPNVTQDVGAQTGCEGGFPGLFDMSGNVSEWANECTRYGIHPATDNCLARGGPYYYGGGGDDGADLRCDVFSDKLSINQTDNVGIRCCGD